MNINNIYSKYLHTIYNIPKYLRNCDTYTNVLSLYRFISVFPILITCNNVFIFT